MKIGDRTVAPPLREIEKITLPKIDRLKLSNDIPVWSVNAGTQDVIKIEWLFDAGRWQESQRTVATATGKMLLEGTAKKTAREIAEEIEFYGASINTDIAIDYALVSLFTLNKHLPRLLPLLQEVITEAVFPEKELGTYIQNSKQHLLVNLKKVDFIAHKEFNERLYGNDHPIGYTTTFEDYDSINTTQLQQFHETSYLKGRLRIIVAGRVNEESLKMLDDYFGKAPRNYSNGKDKIHHSQRSPERKFFVGKDDAVQSGIRIGQNFVNKLHPDFPKLRVLNTILGGYFGSRLMQNLREDKGFCYGIHSGIASYVHQAHLSVSTEVGKEVTAEAVKEIYHEIRRLRDEAVPPEELHLVKNYLLGVLLADADGPFNVSDILRGLIAYDLDESHFYKNVEQIKSVTPDELLLLANEHLDPDAMIEVVAGSN